VLRARRNHHGLSEQVFPIDILPISETDIGAGSLALFLGSEPIFSPETVWFEPCIRECPDPEALPPFTFDESNPWWKITETTLKACAHLASGKYLVGFPDLIEQVAKKVASGPCYARKGIAQSAFSGSRTRFFSWLRPRQGPQKYFFSDLLGNPCLYTPPQMAAAIWSTRFLASKSWS